MTAPKGPWQEAHPTLAVCPHHRGTCAYRVGDPDRCDRCHAAWAVITGKWGEDAAGHTAAHVVLQDRAADKAAARTDRKPAQEGRQTLNGYALG